jgi:hypothetical protein
MNASQHLRFQAGRWRKPRGVNGIVGVLSNLLHWHVTLWQCQGIVRLGPLTAFLWPWASSRLRHRHATFSCASRQGQHVNSTHYLLCKCLCVSPLPFLFPWPFPFPPGGNVPEGSAIASSHILQLTLMVSIDLTAKTGPKRLSFVLR